MKLLKKIGLIVLLLVVIECKTDKEDSKHLLERGKIQLAQPMLRASNTMISDKTFLTIGPQEPGSMIYYTTEGSEPTENATLYEKPFKISTDCIVKVRAFHSDWLESEISEIEFFKTGIEPVNIKLLSELSEKYPGKGISTLIDNEKGTSNFSDLRWIGVNDSLTAIVDFGEPISLQSLKVCFMTNLGAWIFPPKNITLLRSNDGLIFKKFSGKELDIPIIGTNSGLMHTSIAFNIKSRYIKVNIENIDKIPEWHDGSGKSAWIFMDEWIFN